MNKTKKNFRLTLNNWYNNILHRNGVYHQIKRGYGETYIDEAKARLIEHNQISVSYMCQLWRYCKDNNIILRTSKQTNCKKRELQAV